MEMVKVAKLSERLRIAMQAANKIQADLVRETGVDRSAISNYLYGRYEPKDETVAKLAKALNCDDYWLKGYDVPMERHKYVALDDAEFIDSLPPLQDKEEIPPELEALNTLLLPSGKQITKINGQYYLDEAGVLSEAEVNQILVGAIFSVTNMVNLLIEQKTKEMRNYLSGK